jgi:RNA polymerase sigma-70 factor, ECF subfamily
MHSGDGHTGSDDLHAAAREAMARVAGGDAAAFQEIYDGHADVVYSVAMNLLRDEGEAQEVLQEVFLKVWNASERYDPVFGRVVSWLITITRHRCLNRIRSRQRRAAAHDAAAQEAGVRADAAEDSAEVLLRRETAVAVKAALEALPPEQAEAIRLAFLHGLTQEETAGRLNAPLGTVKARIRRGLVRMKEQLQFIR